LKSQTRFPGDIRILTKRDLLRSAALAAITTATSNSVLAQAQTSADRPGFLKAKDIAEAGFIYGLPIVMNYAVMHEYAIDRDSGQFKAPFNQIKNEPNVYTYKDTAVITPNSDTPYSILWMDLRAEPMVLSVPAVDPKRYYSVMLCDGNTYNYGYVGSRATGASPAIIWLSDRTGTEQLRPESKRCFGRPRSFRRRLIARSFSTRTISIT
jgi:hypothetical protein